MERSSEAGSGGQCLRSEPESPDWDALPEPILANILRKASDPLVFRSGRICRRWLAVGRQVQDAFRSFLKNSDVVVRGIAEFPHLTSVTLDRGVSDLVLGAIAIHCPELRHLSLTRYRGGGHPEPSAAGLGTFFKILEGLQKLELRLSEVQLPDTVSCLVKLESLSISLAPGPLPETLGDLPSLKELVLECPSESQDVPEWIFRLTTLHTLHLSGNFTSLPEEMSVFSGLQNLSIVSSALTSFPESLSSLQCLETLFLGFQHVLTLPQNLLRGTSLTDLI